MKSLLLVLTALLAAAANLAAQIFPPPQSVKAESGSLVLTKETAVSLAWVLQSWF